MLNRKKMLRARLWNWAGHPVRSWPDLRQHARAMLALSPKAPASGGMASLPTMINYAINTGCNLTCGTCDTGTGADTFMRRNLREHATPGMTVEEFRRVVRSTRAFAPEYFICAMEPLMHPHVMAHIRAIVDEGLRASSITNGLLLEAKAGELVASGLHQLFVSLDGPTSAVNDPLRGMSGAFDRTVAGIQAVAREKARARSHWPEMILNCTLSPANIRHIAHMADFAVSLPIQSLAFSHLGFVTPEQASAHNRTHSEYPVTPSRNQGGDPGEVDVELLLAQQAEVRNRYGGFPIVFSPDLGPDEVRTWYHKVMSPAREGMTCPVMWREAQLTPNGDVMVTYGCPSHVFGNALERPFQEIWNGEAARDFRLKFRQGMAPGCLRCRIALEC